MLNNLIEDILILIVDMLYFEYHARLLCLNKQTNDFMLKCYFKNIMATNKIPLHIIEQVNNLNTLILLEDTKLTNESLKYSPCLLDFSRAG